VLGLLSRLSDTQTASSSSQVESAMTFIDQIVQSIMSPDMKVNSNTNADNATSTTSSSGNGDDVIAHQTGTVEALVWIESPWLIDWLSFGIQ
jgi:hypothetical protein